MSKLSFMASAAIAAGLVSPAVAHNRPVQVSDPDPGPSAYATASFYNDVGQPIASGGVLAPGAMNVAHKTLPFGTQITFYFKGRATCATVTDRGPYIAGREFDLGPGTADTLGFAPYGVAQVGYRFGCGTRSRTVLVSHCHGIAIPRLRADGSVRSTSRVRRCASVWEPRGAWRYLSTPVGSKFSKIRAISKKSSWS